MCVYSVYSYARARVQAEILSSGALVVCVYIRAQRAHSQMRIGNINAHNKHNIKHKYTCIPPQ